MLASHSLPSDQIPDQLHQLITPARFSELLALAESGHALAALRQAILETAIAVRTGGPVTSPDYV
jgi:hypothetical protein